MDVDFFLRPVLWTIAIYYTVVIIIEKLEEEIRDDALQAINKYVAAQSGDYLAIASVFRRTGPLGFLLSIAGVYIAKKIVEYLMEKFEGYVVAKICRYVVAPFRDNVVAPIGRQFRYLLCYNSSCLQNMNSNAACASTLDFLCDSQQELGRQNPHLMRLIQENQSDFPRLIYEPIEGGEGNILGQLASAMSQQITITPEEREAIEHGLQNMISNAAGAGTLDYLRYGQQFQDLRAMVQADRRILQPMLQELGRQNPHLIRLIQEHLDDFLRLIFEPIEGGEGNILGQQITVTPEEREAIERGLQNMISNAAGAGTLDYLRGGQQFQDLRAMVQADRRILQPMLQELGRQNPHLIRLIQEHLDDFLRLIFEPIEGGEGNILGQQITVTPEEREAIERLEANGFDRAIVLEVFFACNTNEELATNYLLNHGNQFED